MMKYIDGDLIKLAQRGNFNVIAHGCNCFCQMGSGIAPQMAEAFGCDEFEMERTERSEYDEDTEENYSIPTYHKGDINKLGNIDFEYQYLWFDHPMVKEPGVAIPMSSKSLGQENVKDLIVVNAYTQYKYGRNHADGDKSPVDYAAIEMCMKKINHLFKGKHIGLPKIGAGLAGGDWDRIEKIINTELKDCEITIVNYKPE
jgi:O-acetyl-ADP-ribose deacetylase (regulator of RNase III)